MIHGSRLSLTFDHDVQTNDNVHSVEIRGFLHSKQTNIGHPLPACCAVLSEWCTRVKCLEQELQTSPLDDASRILKLSSWCTTCLDACSQHAIQATKLQGQSQSDLLMAAQKAAQAVETMLFRMDSIVNAKILSWVMDKTLAAHVLQTDWASERQSLEDPQNSGSVATFTAKLEKFESAFSAVNAALLQDPNLETKLKGCGEYCNKFVHLCDGALDQEVSTFTHPLQLFKDKFGQMEKAANDLELAPACSSELGLRRELCHRVEI